MSASIHATSGRQPAPFVFLSASIPDGRKQYPGSDRHEKTARAQWIRDAVLAISRAALKRQFRLRFGAHPSISPMILTVAREFAPAATPRIEVFQSKFFLGKYAPETYELASPPYGDLVETDKMSSKEDSLAHMREEMLQRPGLIAAVFIGGMDGVIDEANRFQDHYGAALHGVARRGTTLPAYAIASAGGAAADLLDPQYGGQPAEYSGGQLARVDTALLEERSVGYTRVARAILDSLEHHMTSGSLVPATTP